MASEISQILLQGAQLIGNTIQSQQQLFQQRQKLAADVGQAEAALSLEKRKLELQQENDELARQLEERRVEVSERNAAVSEGNLNLAQEGRALREALDRARLREFSANATLAEQRARSTGEPLDLTTAGGREANRVLQQYIEAEVDANPKWIESAGVDPRIAARLRGQSNDTVRDELKFLSERAQSLQTGLATGQPGLTQRQVDDVIAQRDEIFKYLGARTTIVNQALAGQGEASEIIGKARQRMLEVTNMRPGGVNDRAAALAESISAFAAGDEPSPLAALQSALNPEVDPAVAAPRIKSTLLSDPTAEGAAQLIAEEWDALLRPFNDKAGFLAALQELRVYAKYINPSIDFNSAYAPVISELARRRGLTKKTTR